MESWYLKKKNNTKYKPAQVHDREDASTMREAEMDEHREHSNRAFESPVTEKDITHECVGFAINFLVKFPNFTASNVSLLF